MNKDLKNYLLSIPDMAKEQKDKILNKAKIEGDFLKNEIQNYINSIFGRNLFIDGFNNELLLTLGVISWNDLPDIKEDIKEVVNLICNYQNVELADIRAVVTSCGNYHCNPLRTEIHAEFIIHFYVNINKEGINPCAALVEKDNYCIMDYDLVKIFEKGKDYIPLYIALKKYLIKVELSDIGYTDLYLLDKAWIINNNLKLLDVVPESARSFAEEYWNNILEGKDKNGTNS